MASIQTAAPQFLVNKLEPISQQQKKVEASSRNTSLQRPKLTNLPATAVAAHGDSEMNDCVNWDLHGAIRPNSFDGQQDQQKVSIRDDGAIELNCDE